jgi:hypothetical protein
LWLEPFKNECNVYGAADRASATTSMAHWRSTSPILARLIAWQCHCRGATKLACCLARAMNDPPKLNAKPMPFRCSGCQVQPALHRRYRIIVMGCQCGVVTWDYQQLPSIPQSDHEWSQWLSLAKLDLDVSLKRSYVGPLLAETIRLESLLSSRRE